MEETGDGTGVFQTTVDIPTGVSDGGNSTALELGEVITLTYRDTGLAGESSVNADSADVEATNSNIQLRSDHNIRQNGIRLD